MASFFFSNDEAVSAPPAGEQRPTLTAIQGGQPSTVAGPASSTQPDRRRQELAPPMLFTRTRPAWRSWLTGFWYWLWDLDDVPQPAPSTGLSRIKAEFNSAIWDLQSSRATQVRGMVEQARSLRELWHLRAEVFKVISVHRGQMEAQTRVDVLDSHFPVRSSSRASETRHAKVTSW
jgi:hypothetical protein